jgi:hypothetical protein
MTPTQIAEAQRLTGEWKPRSPQQTWNLEDRADGLWSTDVVGARSDGYPLKKVGGTFVVPVEINGAIVLDFTIDSGAADVSVPADVFSTLTRTGTIRDIDVIGEKLTF